MENTKNMDAMSALKAEYEAKLLEKDAEIALLKNIENSKKEEKMRRKKAAEDYLNEYVSIKLFRDNDKYKDDVYVAVNGKNCIIKRGEWVKIRRKFALVIDQSEIQDLKTAEFLEAQQKKFEEAKDVL